MELSEGFGGYLSRTEVFFYTLDFVPLIVALLAYIPFWPGRFIPKDAANGLFGDGSRPSDAENVEGRARTGSADVATLSEQGEKEAAKAQ